MSLKFKYKSKDEIPAEQAGLYKETTTKVNGADQILWILDCEGAVDKERLDEFRANNNKVSNELKALRDQYDGIDADVARELITKQADLDDDKLVHKGEIDKVVEKRTKAMREEQARLLTAAQTENQKLLTRLTEVEINQSALTEGTKRGLKATATVDLMARARSVFRLENGKVVAYEADGKTVRFGKDGITPFSITEWIELQVTEAPHLFEESKGAGAEGSGSKSGNGSGPNPWKTDSWNLTRQMQIQKTDPALMKRLKAEAGAK
jgi:hypothetical protein